ncbi:DNAse I-like superfamily protein [Striga asiatica]|uniref:DNAse I-like superfamily protein n=1 Tax=Striga asiatica TaxID=4170 RepID=A0A5A7PB99_STRAF|nr:DNAse I-like superfamily protein [Striga asiatica]
MRVWDGLGGLAWLARGFGAELQRLGDDRRGPGISQLLRERRFCFVEPDGSIGGMLLCWDMQVMVLQVRETSFSIQIQFKLKMKEDPCWLTFVYLSTELPKRMEQWQCLITDKEGWGEEWCIIGDWNDLHLQENKSGGRPRSLRSLVPFQTFISDMGMTELSMKGHKYTWCNNRENEGIVEEKLDNAFGSMGWMIRYPLSQFTNIYRSASDHGMLLLKAKENTVKSNMRFTFDKRWATREGVRDIVSKAWAQSHLGTPFFKLKEQVKVTRVALSKWSQTFGTNNKRKIKQLTLKLEEMRSIGEGKNWEE